MKIKLNEDKRKYIEIEVEIDGKTYTLKYYEKNTKQIKAIKKATKSKSFMELDDLNEKQFFENLKGDKKVIDALVKFYETNGNIYNFINECDKELGKLYKRG